MRLNVSVPSEEVIEAWIMCHFCTLIFKGGLSLFLGMFSIDIIFISLYLLRDKEETKN